MANQKNSRLGCGTLAGWGALLSGIAAILPMLTSNTNNQPEQAVVKPAAPQEELSESNSTEELEVADNNIENEEKKEKGDAEEIDEDSIVERDGGEEPRTEPLQSPARSSPLASKPTPEASPRREPEAKREVSTQPTQTPAPQLRPLPTSLPGLPSTPPARPLPPLPRLPSVPSNVSTQRVQFSQSRRRVLVANSVDPNETKRYVISSYEGQILEAKVKEGSATFDIRMPGGEIVANAEDLTSWIGLIPTGGDYSIDIQSSQPADFTLEISLCSSTIC